MKGWRQFGKAHLGKQGVFLVLLTFSFLTGCATQSPYTYSGAAVGAAAGAGLGAGINNRNPWKGAAIGGLLGGAAGAVAGEAYGRSTSYPAQPQPPGYYQQQSEAYYQQ